MPKYDNARLTAMRQSIAPMLERADIIGFVAAKNARAIDAELREFDEKRDELIRELGTEEVGEDGEPTGSIRIDRGTPEFEEFARRIKEYAEVECEVNVCTVPVEKTEGLLSGNEMLAVEWMFDWGAGDTEEKEG